MKMLNVFIVYYYFIKFGFVRLCNADSIFSFLYYLIYY